MSISKMKITLLSLLISTSILSSSLYAGEPTSQPVETTEQPVRNPQQKHFLKLYKP